MSETAKIRDKILPFLEGRNSGIDIGFGGDPIIPSAMTIDQVEKYSSVGDKPQQLFGDARMLYWFNRNVLDYVYSSHVLEDFLNPLFVVDEWLRVLKIGGVLILYLPNEIKFKASCKATGQVYNFAHKNDNMSLAWMLELMTKTIYRNKIIFTHDEMEENQYGFCLIAQKLS